MQNWFDLGLGQVVTVRDADTLDTAWQATFPRSRTGVAPDPYPMAVADGRLFVVDHDGKLPLRCRSCPRNRGPDRDFGGKNAQTERHAIR